MPKSITYHITLFVMKLMGVKKMFSENPINYLKLRKGDVFVPKGKFYKGNRIFKFSVLKTQITQLAHEQDSDNLLIYLHGGAFISGPTKLHWNSLKTISKNTQHHIWLCNYPKAPEHKIDEISANIDAIYQYALATYKSANITIMGDSVGGTLTIALTQRLIQNGVSLPAKIILVSPVLDATFSNPQIDTVEKIDPVLSKKGIISAKKMCSENLMDPSISPLYGNFESFPPTFLYAAANDIAYPDELIFAEKMKASKSPIFVTIGKEMPHIWPLLPVMHEAKLALTEIIEEINR
jgi:acetyl esterase/lipase